MKKLAFILLALALISGVCVYGAIHLWRVLAWDQSHLLLPQQARYQVGQCFVRTDAEPWEYTGQWKLEMIGHTHYLLRHYPASLLKEISALPLTFDAIDLFTPVACVNGSAK